MVNHVAAGCNFFFCCWTFGVQCSAINGGCFICSPVSTFDGEIRHRDCVMRGLFDSEVASGGVGITGRRGRVGARKEREIEKRHDHHEYHRHLALILTYTTALTTLQYYTHHNDRISRAYTDGPNFRSSRSSLFRLGPQPHSQPTIPQTAALNCKYVACRYYLFNLGPPPRSPAA